MGNVLADNAYANLNKVVQHIHNQVYKGTRDRNRYQLTHGIYVWWEAGKITKIFERVTNRKLEFKQDKIAVENNHNNFGNIGFYHDATKLVNSAIMATTSPKKLEVYSQMGDLQRAVRSDVELLLNLA